MAVPPARSIWATTARLASSFRSTMPTLAPSAANRSEEAPPMPVAPPEINAIFPANLPGMCFHPSSQKPLAILERLRLWPEVVREGKRDDRMSRYREIYATWKADPQAFWAEAASAVDWFKPNDKVFDQSAGQYGRWFPGALCNTAYNCLDRHVQAGRGGALALIYDSPVTSTKRTYSFS